MPHVRSITAGSHLCRTVPSVGGGVIPARQHYIILLFKHDDVLLPSSAAVVSAMFLSLKYRHLATMRCDRLELVIQTSSLTSL